MIENEKIASLKSLGLNLYESKAYNILLQERAATAHQIAKKSGVPSGKIYPVLDALITKSFISSMPGTPKVFVIVSPDLAFTNVIDQKKKELHTITENAKKISTQYALSRKMGPETKEELVETYFGHTTAFARSITLHNETKKYWKTISHLTLKQEHLDACRNAVKRGVTIQALTSTAETTPERVAEWRKRGIEVRFLPELPFRVSVYDNIGVIFRFSHEQAKQYVATHIRNPKLAKGMSTFFDNLWAVAKKEP